MSISRSGEVAAFRRRNAVELVHFRDDRRRIIEAPGPTDFEFGAGGLWLLGDEHIHWMTETGDSLVETLVGPGITALSASRSALPSCLLTGRGMEIVELYDEQLFAFPLVLGTRPGERLFPLGPRLVGVVTDEHLRLTHLEKGNLFVYNLPEGVSIGAVCPLFCGTATAIVLTGALSELWLLSPTGRTLMRTDIPRPDHVAFAEDRGLVIISAGDILCALDLQRDERQWAEPPFVIDDLDVCANGRELVVAQRTRGRPKTCHASVDEVFEDLS